MPLPLLWSRINNSAIGRDSYSTDTTSLQIKRPVVIENNRWRGDDVAQREAEDHDLSELIIFL